jgi:transcription initiation factor IIE alpha subunit
LDHCEEWHTKVTKHFFFFFFLNTKSSTENLKTKTNTQPNEVKKIISILNSDEHSLNLTNRMWNLFYRSVQAVLLERRKDNRKSIYLGAYRVVSHLFNNQNLVCLMPFTTCSDEQYVKEFQIEQKGLK